MCYKISVSFLSQGISICGPGVPLKEIGFAIDKLARSSGFTVVPAFLGHGIGDYFHGPPDIYHTSKLNNP